jgi:hypothetical protein
LEGQHLSNFGDLLLGVIFVHTVSEVYRDYRIFLFEKIVLLCKEVAPCPSENSTKKSWSLSRIDLYFYFSLKFNLADYRFSLIHSSDGHARLRIFWRGDTEIEVQTLRGRSEEHLSQWEGVIMQLVNSIGSPDAPAPAFSARSSLHRSILSFCAIVLYDFIAERTDELNAKANDLISVVANSSVEWFVAKLIGRLGRPGLIPMAFVEIRDPSTNQSLAGVVGIIARGELPTVEGWKQRMTEYRQSSISLDTINTSTSHGFRRNYRPPPQSTYGIDTSDQP